MKVNYKFQFKIRFHKINFNLDDTLDIELSNFDRLSSVKKISDDIDTIRGFYYLYYGYDSSLLANQLDKQDLAFLSFLEDVRSFSFDSLKFDGELPLVECHGDGYEFLLYVNEG